MKTTVRILILLLASVVAAACTHNNGDIGPLFGTWALDRMTVDGTDATLPDDADTFIQFQSKVVMVKLIGERATLLEYRVGSWQREGDVLKLDFNHYDDEREPGTGLYEAPAWLHFQPKGITTLRVVQLKGGGMRLEQTTPEGEHIEYEFHKTY
ncbi:MAG: lipocalin-like domain-containing protein [Muribaculaceae bacterium]|nr:lipocalin-like domain-containing protein [Muribaculaceae bacterium]